MTYEKKYITRYYVYGWILYQVSFYTMRLPICQQICIFLTFIVPQLGKNHSPVLLEYVQLTTFAFLSTIARPYRISTILFFKCFYLYLNKNIYVKSLISRIILHFLVSTTQTTNSPCLITYIFNN